MPTGRPPAVPDLHPGEAKTILEGLRRERRVPATIVAEYREKIQNEIHELVQRLHSLGWSDAAGAGAAAVAAAGAGLAAGLAAGKAIKKARSTPGQIAVRQLQGRYLGLSRKIPATKMAEFKMQIPVVGKAIVVQAMADYIAEQKAGSSDGGGTRKKRRSRKRK
jgi:hypothetical protein